MTGQREAQLLDATNLILDARRTSTPIARLPADLAPATLDEASWIQDQLVQAYGPIGGWKVGPSANGQPPSCAPMPRAWMAPDAAMLSFAAHRFRGLEAEVAFLLGTDLPPRISPYTLEEIQAAIQSCHPAIEVLESAFTEPLTAPELDRVADLQIHGAFVFGPACAAWPAIDFTQETVSLSVDSVVRVEHSAAATPPGFFLGLLLALANEGAARTRGLRAGQFITTGSWTGVTTAASGSTADVRFTTLGEVSLSFA